MILEVLGYSGKGIVVFVALVWLVEFPGGKVARSKLAQQLLCIFVVRPAVLGLQSCVDHSFDRLDSVDGVPNRGLDDVVAVDGEEVSVWAAIDCDTLEVLAVEVSPGRSSLDALLFLRDVSERCRGMTGRSTSSTVIANAKRGELGR